jgi:hypothetical protein
LSATCSTPMRDSRSTNRSDPNQRSVIGREG